MALTVMTGLGLSMHEGAVSICCGLAMRVGGEEGGREPGRFLPLSKLMHM